MTALSELRRQNKRIAVTSMCVGTVSCPQFYIAERVEADAKFDGREWAWQVYSYLNIKLSFPFLNIYKVF